MKEGRHLSIKMGDRKYMEFVGINKVFYEQIVRPRILEYWSNKCSKCNNKHKRMHLHHLSYKIQNKYTIVPLCPSCHKKIHNELKRREIDYKRL